MELLDKYKAIRDELFTYFGYVENWMVLPIDDAREFYWRLESEISGSVEFADTEEELKAEDGNYYANEIYTQRHLDKWVYRGAEYTMILVDTDTDGNQFLQIFDNSKERPTPNT